MNHSLIKFLLSCIFIFSCTGCSIIKKEKQHISISNSISKKFIKDMEKRGVMYTSGGGAFHDGVNQVSLTFKLERGMSLKEGRKLYIEMVETLIKRYNENETVRPYLKDYPFDTHNINITLDFYPDFKFLNEATLRSIGKTDQDYIHFIFEGGKRELAKISGEGLVDITHTYNPFPTREKLESNSRIIVMQDQNEGMYFESYDEAYQLVCKKPRDKAAP